MNDTRKSLSLVPFVFLFLLYTLCLSGCVGSKADAQEKDTPAPIEDTSQDTHQKLQVLKTEDLTEEAKSIYAILLCEQAYRDQDEGALIEAVEILEELKAPVQAWMEAGIWLLGRKSENAVFFLQHAHACWPKDNSLLLLLAEALQEKNELDAAIALVRNFIKKNPSNDAKIELAILLVNKKNFAEAERVLSQIPKQDTSPLVDLTLGKALSGMEKYEEAIPYLQRASREIPDLADPLIELGKIYERLGQIPQAIKTYENVLKTDYPSKKVLLKLISLCLIHKQPEKALRYLEEGPSDIPFQLTVADMFITAKNYLQATNILKPLAAQEGAPIEVYLLLADLTWEHLRDLQASLAWLDTMPDEYKKTYNAVLLRIHLLARADKKEEAIAQAILGKRLFPEETKFWEDEARILMSDGKINEALAVMQDAIKKWPKNTSILFLMGSILDEAGDKESALSLMEKIIERDPNNVQALNYVGYSLADENRELDKAVKLLERAAHIAPNLPYLVDSLAWVYYRLGRYKDALREIRRAIKLDATHDATIWEHYGDIAKQSGLTEEAKDAYGKAIEMKPDSAERIRKKIAQ